MSNKYDFVNLSAAASDIALLASELEDNFDSAVQLENTSYWDDETVSSNLHTLKIMIDTLVEINAEMKYHILGVNKDGKF